MKEVLLYLTTSFLCFQTEPSMGSISKVCFLFQIDGFYQKNRISKVTRYQHDRSYSGRELICSVEVGRSEHYFYALHYHAAVIMKQRNLWTSIRAKSKPINSPYELCPFFQRVKWSFLIKYSQIMKANSVSQEHMENNGNWFGLLWIWFIFQLSLVINHYFLLKTYI